MILAFGLTQYNFGAVVFTLNANGVSVGLDKVKYSVVCLVKLPIDLRMLVSGAENKTPVLTSTIP